MSRTLTFHPLVQKDRNEILAYYETEASVEIADQFEQELRAAIASIKENPRHFPFYLNQRRYRRCSLPTFPHLILFRENPSPSAPSFSNTRSAAPRHNRIPPADASRDQALQYDKVADEPLLKLNPIRSLIGSDS